MHTWIKQDSVLRQAVSTWSALRWCKYVASWHIICKTTRLLISQCGLNPSLSLHQELLTCTVRTNSMAFNSLTWSSRLCLVNAGICSSHSITLRKVLKAHPWKYLEGEVYQEVWSIPVVLSIIEVESRLGLKCSTFLDSYRKKKQLKYEKEKESLQNENTVTRAPAK